MTVIAHINVHGTHSLIGDLLVSSVGTSPTSPVNLPASADINARISLPENRFIVGLQQKVVVLNPSLAIAWSGNFGQAQALFADLEPLRSQNHVDPEFVRTILDNIDQSQKDDLSLIGMVATNGRCSLITHRTEQPTSIYPAQDVVSAGSGSSTFTEILRQHAPNSTALNPNASATDIADGFDLNIVGSMQSEEFSTPMGIQNGWGGGFELARFAGSGISKIDNILSVHFFFLKNAENGFDLYWLPDFRHTSYWQDFTVVQGIEHPVEVSGMMLPGRRDIFVIGPPGRPPADLTNFVPPDFHRQSVVMASIEEPVGQDIITVPSFSSEPAIQFDAPVGSTRVHVSFDLDFLAGLIAIAQHKWRRPVAFKGVGNRPVF
jgi:hypothetical protein